MVIKLDMEKVYGRLSCQSIKECVSDLGFTEKWTN